MMGAIERLYRIAMYSIGRGRITTGDTSGPVQLYQVQVNDMDIRDNVPRLAEFGFTSRPPDGSDVTLTCVEGNPRKSVIVGTNHQPSLPKGLLAGETVIFNLWGMTIEMTEAGITVNGNGKPVRINGDVVLNGGMTSSGDVVAGGVSLLNHLTTGVKAGTDISGKPQQ
jgi:phage gp45-like